MVPDTDTHIPGHYRLVSFIVNSELSGGPKSKRRNFSYQILILPRRPWSSPPFAVEQDIFHDTARSIFCITYRLEWLHLSFLLRNRARSQADIARHLTLCTSSVETQWSILGSGFIVLFKFAILKFHSTFL